MILIYAETGSMGEILSPVLGGIVGMIKYVIPLGMIGLSISLVKNELTKDLANSESLSKIDEFSKSLKGKLEFL